MSTPTFQRATKRQAKLRMAIDGPSGSGKTFTALTFAFALARGGTVAVIDTERGSASKYAGQFPEFDALELESFGPALYTDAIHAAEAAGYSVLVIDSLSHAWEGVGGALELVDQAKTRGANQFTSWKDVTPLHRRMVDAILQARCHVITTMRSKTEYVLEQNEKGKQVPRKVGMAPVQRQGIEYEFDVVADMDLEHHIVVTKSRCTAIDSAVGTKPTGAFIDPLIAWLTDGAEARPTVMPAPLAEPPKPAPAATEVEVLNDWSQDRAKLARVYAAAKDAGIATRAALLALFEVEHLRSLRATFEEVLDVIAHYAIADTEAKA